MFKSIRAFITRKKSERYLRKLGWETTERWPTIWSPPDLKGLYTLPQALERQKELELEQTKMERS